LIFCFVDLSYLFLDLSYTKKINNSYYL